MKKYLSALLAPLLLSGCYSPHTFPLQPGEKIIFNSEERADQYRRLSGNDRYHAGCAVQITRPCAATAE